MTDIDQWKKYFSLIILVKIHWFNSEKYFFTDESVKGESLIQPVKIGLIQIKREDAYLYLKNKIFQGLLSALLSKSESVEMCWLLVKFGWLK